MADINDRPHLKLLSLDGGGVRGLSSLYLLKQLMEGISNPAPKPCKFFDMIGGTSTGGLIAIMLGRLEMTVQECIDNYIEMMDGVFKKTGHRLVFDLQEFNMQLQGRFDTAELEAAIKRAVVVSKLPEDAKFRDAKAGQCKVFVCAASDEDDSYGVQFASWPRIGEPGALGELCTELTIWEAARATSAASTFFEPIQIGRNGRVFRDGATNANNPVQVLWALARDEWGGQQDVPFEQQVKVLVSIGTGASAIYPFGNTPKSMMGTLKRLTTETEKTADIFYNDRSGDLLKRDAYLRLNVKKGLENVRLEDASQRRIIATATDKYGSSGEVQGKITKFCATAVRDENPQSMTRWHPSAPSNQLVRSTSSPFTRLNASNQDLKLDVESYWESLLVTALQVYEQVYQEAADEDGKVRFFRLLACLPPNNPLPIKVLTVYQRLVPSHTQCLTKNQTLAALYMLHVEQHLPKTPKRNETGEIILDPERRLITGCFGNWESCVCQYGRRWNFANRTGLWDDTKQERDCETRKSAGKPLLARLLSSEARLADKITEANKQKWMESWKKQS